MELLLHGGSAERPVCGFSRARVDTDVPVEEAAWRARRMRCASFELTLRSEAVIYLLRSEQLATQLDL